jgi:hypothetical protein
MAEEVVDLTFSDSDNDMPIGSTGGAREANQLQARPNPGQQASQDSQVPKEEQQRKSIMQFAQERAKRMKLSPEVDTAADGPPAANAVAGTSASAALAAQSRDDMVLSVAPASNQLLAQLARERQARQQQRQQQEGASTSGEAAAGRL